MSSISSKSWMPTTCGLGHRIPEGAAYCEESAPCHVCFGKHHEGHEHLPHSKAIQDRIDAVELLRRCFEAETDGVRWGADLYTEVAEFLKEK